MSSSSEAKKISVHDQTLIKMNEMKKAKKKEAQAEKERQEAEKRRQIALENARVFKEQQTAAIDEYFRRLRERGVEVAKEETFWYGKQKLMCIEIDYAARPDGFSLKNPNTGLYSYYIPVPISMQINNARRMSFLMHPMYGHSAFQISHLCHNERCYNPFHLAFETAADNTGRNGCCGGPFCGHSVPCLRPGPYFQAKTSFQMTSSVKKLAEKHFEKDEVSALKRKSNLVTFKVDDDEEETMIKLPRRKLHSLHKHIK